MEEDLDKIANKLKNIETHEEMQKFKEKMEIQMNQLLIAHQMILKLTNLCWNNCIQNKPGMKLSPSERNCFSNCANNFLESKILLMNHFSKISSEYENNNYYFDQEEEED